MGKPSVVLLSGGLDSATAAAIARSDGHNVHALSFSYGQRHSAELDAAKAVAAQVEASEHRVIELDLRAFGGSALTDDIPVPKGRSEDEMNAGIPVTYVPARNTIFLSYALAFAEVIGAIDIYIGVNALDYSGYPDCRPEYVDAFQQMARLATKASIEGDHVSIHAPLISLTKSEIIQLGTKLGVDYGLTVSCYDASASGLACGLCDSCALRRKGFSEAEIPDPTSYVDDSAFS